MLHLQFADSLSQIQLGEFLWASDLGRMSAASLLGPSIDGNHHATWITYKYKDWEAVLCSEVTSSLKH